MRVIDTSILPNTWQYDRKDCFITAEGYGDLTKPILEAIHLAISQILVIILK